MDRESGIELELDNAVTGLTVVGRGDERIGDVVRTSFDRSCLFVAVKGRFGRKKERVIHRVAIGDVDVDAMRLTVRATQQEVEAAPEYHDLDGRSSEAAERYYRELGAAG